MTKPYQPSFSIQPTYGFRYMSQPFADNISQSYEPPKYPMPKEPKVVPDYKPPKVNNQAVMDTSDSNDNQNAEKSNQLSLDTAQSVSPRDYDAEEKGVFGKGEVYRPSPTGLLAAVSPFGLGSFTGPAVPTSGYGSPGSISSLTGGTFNEQGRSIDPITGYANPEFATAQAFTNYMLDDPLGNTFGDVDNQFSYSENNPNVQNTNQAQAFEFAMANSPLGKDEDGMTQDDKNLIAQKIGLDMGIDESSLDANSPTVDAIQGIGYSETGAAPTGSQFSSTGTFSSGNNSTSPSVDTSGVYSGDMTDDNTDDSFDSYSGSTSATATAGQGQGTGTSYADDAAASDSGGGGK